MIRFNFIGSCSTNFGGLAESLYPEQDDMKVGKTDRTNRTGRIKSGYKADAQKTAASPTAAISVSASVLGIPEAEFTPRVRDAIMTLMHEVDRLRREVEHPPERLREVESMVLEDNVVEWALKTAQVEDKPVPFDELMGNRQ